MKSETLKTVIEKREVVSHAKWGEEKNSDDFEFLNVFLLNPSLSFTRPIMMDYTLYPRMSDAIKAFKFDTAKKEIEVRGEAGGLRMHSWVRVNEISLDEIQYEIIKGDMKGFKMFLFLYDYKGKTLIFCKGFWPRGKAVFSKVIAFVFPTIAEMVISAATKNFRQHIEDAYSKQKKDVESIKKRTT